MKGRLSISGKRTSPNTSSASRCLSLTPMTGPPWPARSKVLNSTSVSKFSRSFRRSAPIESPTPVFAPGMRTP